MLTFQSMEQIKWEGLSCPANQSRLMATSSWEKEVRRENCYKPSQGILEEESPGEFPFSTKPIRGTPPPPPPPPVTVGRTGPEFMRTGDLSLPITDYITDCILGRASPASCLGSTVGLGLDKEEWATQPQGQSERELTPPLVFLDMTWHG